MPVAARGLWLAQLIGMVNQKPLCNRPIRLVPDRGAEARPTSRRWITLHFGRRIIARREERQRPSGTGAYPIPPSRIGTAVSPNLLSARRATTDQFDSRGHDASGSKSHIRPTHSQSAAHATIHVTPTYRATRRTVSASQAAWALEVRRQAQACEVRASHRDWKARPRVSKFSSRSRQPLHRLPIERHLSPRIGAASTSRLAHSNRSATVTFR